MVESMNESFFSTHSPWSYLASTGNGPNIFCHKKCHTRVNCDPWATKTAPKITDKYDAGFVARCL